MAVSDTAPRLDARTGPAAALSGGEAGRTALRDLERLEPRLRLARQPLLEAHADPVDRRAAVGEHRLLGKRGECLRILERAVEVLALSHDLREEADRQRLVGGHHAAREDDVERAAEPDDARQALRAAGDPRDAPAPLGEAEGRSLSRDPEVAPER